MAAALVVPSLASSLIAQQAASPHEGLWIGFGVGGGYHLSGPPAARGGGAGQVRLGGTVNPWLLVGGELTGWGRDQNQTTALRGNIMGAALVYPAGPAGFVKAGVGLATQSVSLASAGPGRLTDVGVGGALGVGYDLRIADNLFLTATLDFLLQVISDRRDSLALMTIGVTWH
ncbi:MAG TPA: outer membrane beta-barrel protein [Gemmatimonadales bacterium]